MFRKMFRYEILVKNYLKVLEINILFIIGKNFFICRNWYFN